jgi:hypothetical protein
MAAIEEGKVVMTTRTDTAGRGRISETRRKLGTVFETEPPDHGVRRSPPLDPHVRVALYFWRKPGAEDYGAVPWTPG